MEKIYYSGHNCFGDCFCLCAAGYLKSLETKKTVNICFPKGFISLIKYFDNLNWVEKTDKLQLTDCGIDPGNDFYLYNAVSRFSRFMNLDKNIIPDIHLNISGDENREFVSILLKSHSNGLIGHKTLETMLKRAKNIYPNKKYIFIGNVNNPIEPYADLQKEYNIEDHRSKSKSCEEIMIQLSKSELVMGPVTGPMLPALGLCCHVWCEKSPNSEVNYALDFPSNRPFYFERMV